MVCSFSFTIANSSCEIGDFASLILYIWCNLNLLLLVVWHFVLWPIFENNIVTLGDYSGAFGPVVFLLFISKGFPRKSWCLV